MKKFFKQISKSFLIVLMILITTTTFVGCGKNNKSKNASVSTINISDTSQEDDNKTAENVSDNDEENEQNITLSGIYQFAKKATFEDCERDNADEVISFFRTRDFNGVYNAVKPLGFDEFISNFNSTVNAERLFLFEDGKVKEIYKTANSYKFPLNQNAENISDFTSKIVLNDDSTYTIFVNFKYNNTKTPLVVKFQLQKIEDTENFESDYLYTYEKNSARINFDINSSFNEIEIIDNIARFFNLDSNELHDFVQNPTNNILDYIENPLTDVIYGISENFTRFSSIKTDENFKEISFDKVSNNSFSLNGFKYNIEDHYYIIEEGNEVVTLSITVSDNAKLIFNIFN